MSPSARVVSPRPLSGERLPKQWLEEKPRRYGVSLLELQGCEGDRWSEERRSVTRVCGAIAILALMLVPLCHYWAAKVDGGSATCTSQPCGEDYVLAEKERFHLLDNAKVFLTFLVVYGHILYYAHNGGTADTSTWLSGADQQMQDIFMRVRTFPVPMYCMISGVVAQGPVTLERTRRFVQYLVIPSALWILVVKQFVLGLLHDPRPQTAWSATMALLHMEPFEVRGYEWFLIVLILWRASTFLVWSHLTPQATLAWSLLIACVAGYKSLGIFDAPAALLPFFAIGYALPLKRLCAVTDAWPSFTSVLALLAVGVWLFKIMPWTFPEPLPDGYGSFSCCEAGVVFKESSGVDYALYWMRKVARVAMDACLVCIILVLLIPRQQLPLTWVGTYCLYPYLFHGVALEWRERLVTAYPPPVVTSTIGHVIVLLLQVPYALLVLLLFASRPWRYLLSWCFQPVWLDCCFKAGASEHLFKSQSMPSEPIVRNRSSMHADSSVFLTGQ